jgi:protein-tyrosine phosphatase
MQMDRSVEVGGLVNFRDVGGLATPEGRVRPGLLFRADDLCYASDAGRVALVRLDVATVIDLRTSEEREERPGPLPSMHAPLHEAIDEDDLADSRHLTGRAEGEAKLRDLYVLLLERATPQFARIFAALSVRASFPAIVHCAGGKDRTGLTVALVQSALGVPRDAVLDDYAHLRSGLEYDARHEAVHADFVRYGIEPDAAMGLLSTPRWAMQDTLGVLDDAYGGIEAYLTGPCSLPRSVLTGLRANLVDLTP